MLYRLFDRLRLDPVDHVFDLSALQNFDRVNLTSNWDDENYERT